jgi:hypothetical protein
MTYDPTDPDIVRPARGPRIVEGALAALRALSLVGNVVQYLRPARVVERPAPAAVAVIPPPAPPPTECPPPVICPPAPAPCPTGTGTGTASTGTPGTGLGHGPPPPREDLALAQQGEGQVAAAAETAERDPIHRVAQRNVVSGVDQIVTSHSPAAAERFLQRNLPSIASMDCQFRDPAMAEHVRMQLRPMNALARPANRLSEADLARYERELRCPRE